MKRYWFDYMYFFFLHAVSGLAAIVMLTRPEVVTMSYSARIASPRN